MLKGDISPLDPEFCHYSRQLMSLQAALLITLLPPSTFHHNLVMDLPNVDTTNLHAAKGLEDLSLNLLVCSSERYDCLF
jgi:hypothetical protein